MALEVTEKDLDALGAHRLRQRVDVDFDSVDFLNQDQKKSISEIVGEAVTNASKHSIGDKVTSLKAIKLDKSVTVEIANPSNGFPDVRSAPPDDPLPECGYGCHLIDGESESLRQSGVRVDCHYRFEPKEGSNRGQTIFHLSVCG